MSCDESFDTDLMSVVEGWITETSLKANSYQGIDVNKSAVLEQTKTAPH